MPMRIAEPAKEKQQERIWRADGASFSTSETALASARTSPWRKRATNSVTSGLHVSWVVSLFIPTDHTIAVYARI